MIYLGAALLLMAWGGAPDASPVPEQYAQLSVRQQIIVRVWGRPDEESEPVDWKEGKRVKCVPSRAVAGAAHLRQESVDLVLGDQSRVRAKLENSCPALDYYNGFYITPHSDGMICADRQSIRSRMGGECEIDAFRTLEPVKRK